MAATTATASSSQSLRPDSSAASDLGNLLHKQIKIHEVAISELGSLSPSRTIYQRNGNIFFRSTVERAIASEQRLLDLTKARGRMQMLYPA
ncbi:hypothetical protein Dimus_021997 [Dionaea muscipula]